MATSPINELLPDPAVAELDDNSFAAADAVYLRLMMTFALVLGVCSLFFDSPSGIARGLILILGSPCGLLTDYFALAGLGAALFNSGFMMMLATCFVALCRPKMTGSIVGSVFMVAAFSLFGKNIFNALPIVLGVALYCKAHRIPLKKNLPAALLGTSMGPMVSEVSFGLGLPLGVGMALGVLLGLGAGLVLIPLSQHLFVIHRGYNIYNIGFTAGVIGSVFMATLRAFGINVVTVPQVSSGNNLPLSLMLYGGFSLLLIWGLCRNGWCFRGYGHILGYDKPAAADYLSAGQAPVIINMALLGIMGISYVLLVGGELSGPVVGGIFGLAGFGAAGKNPRNYLPVLTGIMIAGMLHVQEINAPAALVAAMFGSTLSPISRRYGPVAGVIAGALHLAVVGNVGYLHGGLNLYNNGFAGGFVAAGLIPLLDSAERFFESRRQGVLAK